MKQVLIQQGQIVVEEVPAPLVEPGAVLVRVTHSCISAGTEMSGIAAGSARKIGWKLLTQPAKIKKAIQIVTERGVSGLVRKVKEAAGTFDAAGYSATGIVLEVGRGVNRVSAGDRVACAGAGYANHAEIIRVPNNLVVPVPECVRSEEASTTTLGAIALQGVRRASPTLGETFVVIGLGIVGQLTAQLLRVNGCRVIGIDLDSQRLKLAQELGMSIAVEPGDNGEDAVARLTDNIGADGVIVTAATPSDEVMSTAFKLCRRKGRVVLVGDVGLSLNRADFYQKELDFFISTSYGPGRYDATYEKEGIDYPVGYVRWTENRNLREYVRLLAERRMNVTPLVTKIYSIDEAPSAYDSLKAESNKPLVVLLEYPSAQPFAGSPTKLAIRGAEAAGESIRIAVIGAGSFAQGIHLPNLHKLRDRFTIRAIVSRTGHKAVQLAKRYGASYAGTDYREVLHDPDVDAVLIATRHNLHAQMVIDALTAGKHVLVEKPLALTRDELCKINDAVKLNQASDQKCLLLTGFNRRFSPMARRIKQHLREVSSPLIINYRMNAGYLPPGHWTHSPEGGGRNCGEACHVYDLFTFLTDTTVDSLSVAKIKPRGDYYLASDNFAVTLAYRDGSIATLTYSAMGSPSYPKESMEIFTGGKTLALRDFQQLDVMGARTESMRTKSIDKGQHQELIDFADAIHNESDWPIPWWQQIQATQIACDVDAQLTHDDRLDLPRAA